MVDKNYTDDDEKPTENEGRYDEFECPECNANNPYDDGFAIGDEILCYYCGTSFTVTARGSGYKLKAV